MNTNKPLTDLELVDTYCEECLDFINPKIFRMINERGLYDIINQLPKSVNEAKAVARARMGRKGKFFVDKEIDDLAGKVHRLEFLRKKLNDTSMTEPNDVIPILNEMKILSESIKDYFKK